MVVAVVVVVAVAAAVLAVGLVRRPFPQTGGELALAGLSGEVTVLRDAQGVPHVYADTAEDLFRGQGYVAAQDRFFEMDLRRHITAGRLAELVGQAGVESDKVIRTMGWRRVAEAELPQLAPETRSYLHAYAEGVNAYLSENDSHSKVSLEYVVLGQQVPDYRIEPWTAVDSLAWLKAMAWDLRGNYEDELTRARLAGDVPLPQLDSLYPSYPFEEHAPILSEDEWSPRPAGNETRADTASADGSASDASGEPGVPTDLSAPGQAVTSAAARTAYEETLAALDAVPATLGDGEGVGSNSWVVSGEHTTTGKPLLANDPHLSVGIPGIWHQTGLHCREVTPECPFDVSGFTFAGMPGVVIGHNPQIAWGFTNLNPDVTDFYLEQVNGQEYLRDGEFVPLTTRTETISVAGGEDVEITVRETVHGPILSDVVESVARAGGNAPINGIESSVRYDVSLAWTGLEQTHTADAIFGLNAATGWEEFRQAAADFAVPAQNLVYADVEGNIGYQAPGLIPVRRSSTSGAPPGFWPSPGANPAYDWRGWVPFDELPHVLNPDDGVIVTANQAVTAGNEPFLTTEWAHGFRSQRILELLTGALEEEGGEGLISPELMAEIQLDTRNDFASALVPRLLAVELGDDEFVGDAQRLLTEWDRSTPAGPGDQAAAAAYYNAVWSQLLDLTFDDELPADLHADGGSRWRHVVALLLERPRDPWWDDRRTVGVVEGRDEILRQALIEARLELTRAIGKDMDDWQWGRMHRLELRHAVLGGQGSPGVVQALFNRGPHEVSGGSALVNATSWDAGSESFDVTVAPSMRMVVDLADLDASRWVNQTGVSGHAFHQHYDDQTAAWLDGEMLSWPHSPEAVRSEAEDELTLVPED